MQLIVRRNPEQFIPDAFLEVALKDHNAAWGAAIIDGAEGLKTASGGKEDMTVQHFKDIMEGYPKAGITFYLTSSDGAVNEDDLFPQTLLYDEADNSILSIFVDANLPGFVKKGSSLSPSTHFVDEWMRPKLSEIAKKIKAVSDDGAIDVPKIMGYLSKEEFRKEILQQVVSRGAITMVSDKSALSFNTGDTAKEYPWGWTSNHLGFGIEVKQPDPPKKKDMFAKRSTVREPGSTGPVADKKAEPQTVAQVGQKLKEAVKFTPKYTVATWTPDSTLSRKGRRSAYAMRIGYIPEGCDDSITIEHYVNQTGALVPWQEIRKSGLDAAGLPKLNNPGRIGEGRAKGDSVARGADGERLPLMSPKTREFFNAEFDKPEIKKIIAETGDVVANAEQAKAMEVKFADFMTQLGRKDMTIADVMKLPFEWLVKVGSDRPEGLALIAWNIKNMLLPRLSKEQTTKVVEEPIKVDATPPDAPAVVEPEAAPAPAAKRDMFAKRKVA